MNPRSYLFVPGNRSERFDKAMASTADVVILDLEDAVAVPDKDAARAHVEHWLGRQDAADRLRTVVRINDANSPWFEADAAMLRRANAHFAMLPKAERADAVDELRQCAGAQLQVIALIETALGVQQVESVAAAEGVARLAFGTIDYALDMGIDGDADIGLDFPASRIAIASRAAGLPSPVAGVTPDIRDMERIRKDFVRALGLGFGAKLCIHPDQLGVVHDALQPAQAELDWALRVVRAADASLGAAIQLDGRMVDKPVLERARAIVRRAK